MIFWRNRLQRNFTTLKTLPMRLWKYIHWKYSYILLTMKSLFYNEFISLSYILEIFLEPMFWIVDHFSKALGPILVAGVIILTSIIVGVVYVVGLPFYWNNYPCLTSVLMVYGHWLLVNIAFNFYMGVRTDPGAPPSGILISEAVSVCKKCISPKPPRTHHCSVCNRCILKMDHHCPWLNNCVGHYNHRYFYMYMVYMVFGTMFIIIFGFEIAVQEIWFGGDTGTGWRAALMYYFGWAELPHDHHDGEDDDMHHGYPVKMNGTHIIPSYGGTTSSPILIEEHPDDNPYEERKRFWHRFFIMLTATLTTGAFISLSTLALWHGRLISKGETSIEAHINKKETERLKKISKVYKNPYNYGRRENWKRFFGLTHGRGLRHILLPSTHGPLGNGLTWSNSLLSFNAHDKVV